MEEIVIRKEETEITINEQAISVSAPGVLVTVMTGEKQASAATVTKKKIQSQATRDQMKRVGKSFFNY